jgi:hypothetical protein
MERLHCGHTLAEDLLILHRVYEQTFGLCPRSALPLPSAASSQEKTASGSTAPRRRRKAGESSR